MIACFRVVQCLMMSGVAAMLAVLSVRHREWRGGLLGVAMMFLAVALNELDLVVKVIPSFAELESELLPIACALMAALFCMLYWRGSTRSAIAEIFANRRFPMLLWGLLMVSLLPNAARSKYLWGLMNVGAEDVRSLRELAQEMTKIFGQFLLVNWAVLFFKDEWHRLIYRPSPHAKLLHSHPLIELGQGARRVCYRIGDTGFCVKFMRDPADTRSGRKLGWRFRLALKSDRFSRQRNINCLEAEAMEKYRQLAGPAVAAALPEVVEVVFDERRGYGVLMSLLTNDDGTPVISADYEMAKRRDPVFVRSCLEQIKAILDELIACSAPFFEPDNFEAQVAGDGSVRIRMIDFEPCDKKFLPVAELLPTVRRMNLRRKAKEYLRRTAEKFDIIRT